MISSTYNPDINNPIRMGETPFFAMFVYEATLPVPKADGGMKLSAWTEVMQERFQMAYAWYARETTNYSLSKCSILQDNPVKV